MAILAGLRKGQRDVVRVRCFLKIRQVATHASRGRPGIFSTRMARCTVQSRVHASERKARKLQVIEIGALPVVNRMTLLALRRESRSDVIRRGRLLEGSLVAGVALNG